MSVEGSLLRPPRGVSSGGPFTKRLAMRQRSVSHLVAVSLLVAAASCGGPGIRTVPIPPLNYSPADYFDQDQYLTSGDVLLVEYPYRPDFAREVTVHRDGRISLPFIGPLMAAGQKPEELEATIRSRYASRAYDPADLSSDRHYLINVGDDLEIRFRAATDMNTTVRVRPDGRISLEMVKSVMAEGKSPEELERELIDAYSPYLMNPDLVVIVKEFTSDRVYVGGQLLRPGPQDLDDASVTVKVAVPRQIFVGGEVRAPGLLAFRPPLSALQAVLEAGGVPRSGDMDNVLIIRRIQADSAVAIRLNLESDLSGGAQNDVLLRPFDIVIVPKTGIAKLNDFLDQYLYQLIPVTRNVNFSFFYDVRNGGLRIP